MTSFPRFRTLALVLGVAFSLTACDASLDPDSADAPDLTAAEADEAAQIVAEALAEDAGGLFASARDLTSAITADEIADGPHSVRGHRDGRAHPPCRDAAGHVLTYDAETGTHVVAYRCGVQTDNVRKSYAVRLEYQYRDAEGGFVPRPVANWDLVDSVAFGGFREGSVEMMRGDMRRVKEE